MEDKQYLEKFNTKLTEQDASTGCWNWTGFLVWTPTELLTYTKELK